MKPVGIGVTPRNQNYEELRNENSALRELLHDKVIRVRELQDQCDQLNHDAACWKFVKSRYATTLGYESPDQLQKKIDKDMKPNFNFHPFHEEKNPEAHRPAS